MNILLVEDEEPVASFIQRGLWSEGWTVTVAGDGETALTLTERESFDTIVLDLMLPGIGGHEVCRELRARNNPTPVLMLTALDKVEDRISGLRVGADDYLAKPFDFDELVVRIEALVRRANRFEVADEASHVLQNGALRFDQLSLEVTVAGERVDLSAKERDILKLLLDNPGRVYSRERILNAVWGVSQDPLTNIVDVYISRLRKKLGAGGKAIETVRGAGYRLANDKPLH